MAQLELARAIGLPELRRHRQQFLHLAKLNPPKGEAAHVGNVFVEYLRKAVE
jgi:hypothetical protein